MAPKVITPSVTLLTPRNFRGHKARSSGVEGRTPVRLACVG